MTPETLFLTHLEWCEQQLLRADSNLAGASDADKKIIRIWLVWGVENGFLHTFALTGDSLFPAIVLFYRPVSLSLLERIREHYYETRFEYDRSGDTLLVDFCYTPGHVPFVLGLLKRSGYPYVAWTRSKTGKIFRVKASHLKTAFGS